MPFSHDTGEGVSRVIEFVVVGGLVGGRIAGDSIAVEGGYEKAL